MGSVQTRLGIFAVFGKQLDSVHIVFFIIVPETAVERVKKAKAKGKEAVFPV